MRPYRRDQFRTLRGRDEDAHRPEARDQIRPVLLVRRSKHVLLFAAQRPHDRGNQRPPIDAQNRVHELSTDRVLNVPKPRQEPREGLQERRELRQTPRLCVF